MVQRHPQLIFAEAELPTEAAYYTFKENMRHGYSIEEIWNCLALHELDDEEIESGYQKLLFTVREFLRSQENEGVEFLESSKYLVDKGYNEALIKQAKNSLN